ncbi:hypothetical protein PPACK8108_LOCUS23253 [Phakopsora pachyrhizi]|uniref:Uncharacterized protein n=1 Tax=Phakopsora pachyrhizi TaxID=170000 RepID=A0AAV0BRS9_PHAPC|nr:hypothetical protein PPACK8108_LOCUS23253 [Phakopsora pachyrhizi]
MFKRIQICFDYKNLIGLQKKLNFGEFDEILKESEANNYEQIQFESIVFEILDRSLEHNLLEFSSREKVIFFRRKTLLLLANDIFSKWSAKPELNGLLHVLDPREQMLSERRLTHILKVMDKEQWKILELAFLSNYMEWYRSSIKISDSINEELESLISDLGKKNPFRVEYWWEQLGTMRGSEINFAPAQIGNLFLYSMLKYQGRFYPENKLSFEFEKRFKYFESSVELLHTIIIFFRSMNISITKLYFFTDGISPMIEAYKVLISSKTIIKGSKKRTREGSEQIEKISKNHSKLLNGVISSTYKEFGNWINANFMARFLAQLSVSVHYLKAGNLDLDLKKNLKVLLISSF